MLPASRLPSLVSIQAFEAAARHGGFAAAAREMGTTAASVSYHVKQLERQIGAPLFRRLAHRVTLTEPGKIVAEEATIAFTALRGSFARALAVDQAYLCVSALPTFASAWLVPRLGQYRRSFPGISVNIDTSTEARDLTAGVIDVAIRNGHGEWPGLRSVRLLPALFTPLCAPGLVGAGDALRRPARGALPLIGRRDWWALWFRASGSDWRPGPERFAASFANEHLDIAAAIAGQGIAIGSPILFQDEIEAGRLVMPHSLVAGDGRAFWLTYPLARQDCPKIAGFREWIKEIARGALDRAVVETAIVLEPEGPNEQPDDVMFN
jgi:LysR family glycine cleavage system transcriptional activator